MSDVNALVDYYCQAGYYRQVQTVCQQLLQKRGDDSVLVFWKLFGLAKEGKVNHAIQELAGLRTKRDVELPVCVALAHWHACASLKDHDAISELRNARHALEDRALDSALLLTATFLWHVGDHVGARKVVERVLQASPDNIRALSLTGWIAVSGTPHERANNAEAAFDRALSVSANSGGKKDLTALMGKAKFLSLSSRFRDSLDVLKQAMLTYPWFIPALIEEAKLLMMIGDWDQSLETAQRVLQQDEFDIEALRVRAMYLLTRGSSNNNNTIEGGRGGDGTQSDDNSKSNVAIVRALDKLTDAITRYEPQNAQLMFQVSQPLARLASRQDAVLKRTARMVDQAAKLDTTSCEYVNELAYQYTLMPRWDKAMRTYEQAAQIDESDATALYGQIYCLIQQGELEDASQQLEFFSVVQESIGRTANLAYLGALLAWRRDRDRDACIAQLNETVDLHVKALRDPRPTTTYDYFVRFNPDLLMEVAGEYLQFCGSSEPMDAGELPCRHLTRGTKLLEKVAAQAPGLLSAQMALARAKFVGNELDDTVRILDRCLEARPSFADAHLLLAHVHLLKGDVLAAQSSLDQALAHDFTVRNSLKYMLPKAQILLAKADLDEAHTVLQRAMDMPGVRSRDPPSSSSSFPGNSNDAAVPDHDRASVFIQYAHISIALNHESDAAKTMAQAAREFKDTPEEVRVVLANAQISLKRGDTGTALRMLGNVPHDSPAFLKAQTLRADIYLTHRNNKPKYVKCYLEMVERWPGNAHMYVLLGEAYMKANLSDEAIKAFEQALKKNPKDYALARRIGKALVSTHDYNRAIEYYNTALKSAGIGKDGQAELKFDLARLYQKLGRFDEAASFLESNSNKSNSNSEGKDGNDGNGDDDDTAAILAANGDLRALIGKVRQTLLLAKVVQGGGDVDEAGRVLERARDLQTMVLESVRGKGPEMLQRQRAVMANICERLAQHHEQHPEQRDENKAIAFHKEALRFDESSIEAISGLAELYLRRGDLENCQQRCVAIMRIDPQNEPASMMLAELMFQRNDVGMALHHYEQLLEVNPANFDALANVITLLRRAGELPKSQRFLKAAEHASPRSAHDPGFFYCQGLYARYANDVNAAISNMNRARKDPVWGRRALVHMIEVYLNPDNANMWDDDDASKDGLSVTSATSGADRTVDSQGETAPRPTTMKSDTQAQRDAVETAKQLLDEFPDKSSNDTQYQILKCYAMMATRDKSEVEMACAQLVALANDDKENVPTLLALATALMMMKQTPKARNQLKRISKLSFNATQADEFEKCWLLLTDIYIGSGKYDLAQDLCKRCLQYNKSSARAWEYMGVIMEKEASYKDAAFHYESAWKHEGKASASIGYKLAFNYLKAQRYLDAIDVANQVIRQFPDYPKIRQDVLAKARAALRP